MKKYLLVVFLYLCGINVHAQSIALDNLINLTSLTNQQAGETLTAGKVFKLQYGEEVNGFVVQHYQTNAPGNKLETVTVGVGFKLANGVILHAVNYFSADPKNITNLISQTKSNSLTLSFQGADKDDNIYIYDNFLYHVVIRLRLDQTKGIIDVTQKQVFAY